ncbi:MAG: ComEC/Rec2 family competence protein [Clostridia bacterium]|nr:ComEC/Rec2 family competence protein [Clostridia bacterium]
MKFFNKRPLLLFALVMMIAMVVAIYHNFFALWLSFLICGASLAVVCLVLWLALKNSTAKYVFSRLFIVGFAVLLAVGVLKIDGFLYERDYSDYSGNAVVSARVAEVGELETNTRRKLVLSNAHIEGEGFSKDLHYNVLLTILVEDDDQSHFVVGSSVDIYAKISFASLYYYGENGLTFYFKTKGISCYGYALESAITVHEGELKLSLADRIKAKVTEVLNNNLDQEYAGLARGMLFGDSSAVDSEIYSDFSNAGIAHLLAVSGLHVGFVVAIFMFICKLLKARGYIRFIIIAAVLALYCYICGFAVSVLRATIMALCMLLAGCLRQKYDMLNALSLAFILIASIFPYSITTIGFQLSFVSVLSICLLAKPITNLLSKIMIKGLARTIATLISVQIGTTIIMLRAFKRITLVAVLSNFICLPIATVAYMVLFVSVIIALICPPIAINVYMFQFVMQAVVKFVHLVARAGSISLAAWKGTVLAFTMLPAMFSSSEYYVADWLKKLIPAGVLWTASLIILLC